RRGCFWLWSRGKICCPRSPSRSCTAGSAKASTTAALSLATTAVGVSLGAKKSLPVFHVRTWQASLVHSRDVGRYREAALGRPRKVSKQRALIKSLMAKALPGDVRAMTSLLALYARVITEPPHDDNQPIDTDELQVLRRFAPRLLRSVKRQ